MEEHLSVRNETRDTTAWPVGRLVRIEVFVTLSCLLLAVLVLLGSGRRTSRSTAFRFVVWSALMLSYQAVSYTIGLMQLASFRNELIVVWGCFLLLLLGCADGIVAYSLNDTNQQTRTFLNQGLQLVYVFLLLLSYIGALPLQLKISLLLLWILSGVKLGMRLRSFLVARRDRVLTVDNKFIADYMLHEHELGGADYDAASMTGYKYVVTGRPANANRPSRNMPRRRPSSGNNADRLQPVTLDLVWQCKGRLLSSDGSGTRKRKDLCMSFAMFKLLRRRLGGYPLHEAGLNKTRDFVKVGLLGGGGGHDEYKRMYRVIEVELGFLFDLFYARYPSPDRSYLIPYTILFTFVVGTSLSTLFSTKLLYYRAASDGGNGNNVASIMFAIWLTRMIIILFIILESFQYLSLVFSDWNKVKMLCQYVQKESWQQNRFLERVLRFMCQVRLTRYWNNSVGQHWLLYSSLQSQHSCISRMPLPGWIRGFLTRSTMTKHRVLTTGVKRAIYEFLKSSLTSIRNGEHTLEKNRMLNSFYWATAQETAVQRILVWHIATTICYSRAGSTARGAAVVEDHEVATTISAYCAYLVSSAPELLPDHSYYTQQLFKAVQLRAQKRLKDCQSREDMYERLTNFAPEDAYDDMLAEGKRLGDELLAEGKRLGDELESRMTDPAVRWKVLAELWVEMLLSVAPSSNVTGHVQKLATGGELITHLWALLTHAGIIDKPMNRYQHRWP